MLVLRKPLYSSSLLGRTTRRLLTTGTNYGDVPSVAYYDGAINAAGRERDFATVKYFLNKRVKDGFFNTTNTFKFILTDLSSLDDLLNTLARLDKGFPRKSAYDSLIARLSRSHQIEQALRVADAMVRGDYGANAVTFHPILSAVTRLRRMEEGWRVMKHMRANRIAPDVTAYNHFLTAYCVTRDVTSAAGVLTKIREEGMEFDRKTYDALVLGACRAGKVDGAIVLLRRMEDDGVQPLYSTHSHVIGSLLKMSYHAQAVEFVMCYAGRDKELDRENFGILASRLLDLKRFDEAKLILDEMRKTGLPMEHKLKDFCELHLNS